MSDSNGSWWRKESTPVSDGAWWKAHSVPAPQHNALVSFARGAAGEFGETMLGGQELLGKGMEAAGVPGGQWLAKDAERGGRRLESELAADRATHPWATGAGEFAGGLIVPGGASARVANPMLRAALAGALGGALQPESPDVRNYWERKAAETGLGAATGAGSERALAGAAHLIAPKLRPEAEKLVGEGVQLTPGQAAGGRWRRLEDALASAPIAGNTIRSAQRRSVETFNRAAINRSLQDIGTTLPPGLNSGHDAIAFAETKFHDAYSKVIPHMRGQMDQAFQNDLVDIIKKADSENLPPKFRDQLRHIIGSEVVARFNAGGGYISGLDAQKIGTQLDGLMKSMKNATHDVAYNQHLGRLVRDVDTALDDMMARNNPRLQAAKDRIDAGYSKFKIVQDASTRASAARESPEGTFTPAQLRASVKARDRSRDKAAFARGDAQMQDLASAARSVLPQAVPDSGTPERAALLGLLGGVGYYEPRVAFLLGMPAAAYTRPASRAFNALLQPPGTARQVMSGLMGRAGPALAPAAGRAASQLILPPSQ